MKKIYALLLLTTALFSNHLSTAQDVSASKQGMWPEKIIFQGNQPAFKQAAVIMPGDNGKTVELKQLKTVTEERDKLGFTHYRYQQTFNGIPVENAILIQHIKNGRVYSQNGKWIKQFPADLTVSPAIAPSAAIAGATRHIGARKYRWESLAMEATLKKMKNDPLATYYPRTALVYYAGEKDIQPANLRLAYKMEIAVLEPLSRSLVFVDAINGNILGSRELTHPTDVPGVAHTVYSGIQNITTSFDGSQYSLKETGRGGGIYTLNALNYNVVDFTDADNNWNNINPEKDEYATDVHWAAEKTYDYYLSAHNRNSYDNAGAPIYSGVHMPVGLNAFWDLDYMAFGDGDALNNFQPLTCMDVVAHEFTHGVTQATSGLIYFDESGALNEGFSDIFGTVVEFANKPNANWQLASETYTIRDMANPNAYQHPDTYQGLYWYAGSADNGGVHTNSGVLNHWFYLLTQGGSGVNDHGTSYSVSGIGINKAAAIAYHLNAYYLTPLSQFADARLYGIMAAENLYGAGSNEAIQTANAFTAVGLYANACVAPTGVSFSSITATGAVVNWTAASNAVNYSVEYRLGTSGAWTLAASTNATSITLTGLMTGSLYQCRIISQCGPVNSGYTINSFSTTCAAPTGLSGSATTTGATVSWAAVPGANNYTLFYYPVNGSQPSVSIPGITGASYTISGLNGGTNYLWSVTTVCNAGNGNTSATQNFTTTGLPPCNAPTGLTANTGVNSVIVKWTGVPGVTNYTVEYKAVTASNWITAAGNPVAGTSLQINGLLSNTQYNWRVRSNCTSQASSFESSQFTTLSICAVPANLVSSIGGPTTVTISWDAVSGVSGYQYEYKPAASSTWTVSSASFGNIIFITGGLQAATTYDWRVRSNCNGSFGNYATAQFTTAAACATPTGLNATNITGTGATVNWTAANGATGYAVDYRPYGVNTWTNYGTTNLNSMNIAGLAEFTLYIWRVKTICNNGMGNYISSSFTTIARCDVPTGLTAALITSNSALVNWNSSYGAGDYTVEYKMASATIWTAMPPTSLRTTGLTGLQPATLYDWRVKANCYNVNSTYTASQFTTASICGTVSNLSATVITSSSAILGWDAIGGAIDYTIEYKSVIAANWINAGNVSNTSYLLTGLQDNINYQWRVKANCSSGSGGFVQSQFITLQLVCNAPVNLSENNITENTAVIQWDAVSGAAGYMVQYRETSASIWQNAVANGTTAAISSLLAGTAYQWQVAAICAGNNNSAFTSSQFTTAIPVCAVPTSLNTSLVAHDVATLIWDAVPNAQEYKVRYRTAVSAGWQNIPTTANQITLSGLTPATLYEWEVSTTCIYGNASVYAASQFTTLQAPPVICNAPAALSFANITTTTALISWQPAANVQEYQLEYKKATEPNWQTIISNNLQEVLTGLIPGTAYDSRVRTKCGVTNVSVYSAPIQFTTLPLVCDAPAGLLAGNVTTSAATLNWSAVANAAGYTVEYKLSSSAIWQNTVVAGTSASINGLTAGSLYDWRVRTDCGNNNASSFATAQFSTLPVISVCNAPNGLQTSYNGSSVTASWLAVAGAVSYRLEYKTPQAASWTVITGISTNSRTISGLATGSSYQLRVQTECSGINSVYSSMVLQPLPCVPAVNNSLEFIDYFKLGGIERTSGAEPGGYINTGLITNLMIGTTHAARISAGFAGAVINQGYAVYIDLNRNGSFADAGEMVFGVGAASSGNIRNFNITIPATAAPGLTNMRVVMLRSGTSMLSCLNGANGEAEDYRVNLISGSSFAANNVQIIAASPEVNEGVTVMPNPSNGIFFIKLPADFSVVKYEMMTAAGKLIMSRNENRNNAFSIDISNQPSGMYLLRLVSKDKKAVIMKLSKM